MEMVKKENSNTVLKTGKLRRTQSMHEHCKSSGIIRSLIPVRQLLNQSDSGSVVGQTSRRSLSDLSYSNEDVFPDGVSDLKSLRRSNGGTSLVNELPRNGRKMIPQSSSFDSAEKLIQKSYLGKFKNKLSSFAVKSLGFPKGEEHEYGSATEVGENSVSKCTASSSEYIPRSKTADSLTTADTPKRDVQLTRCLSLYERRRDPHFCINHHKHEEPDEKTSPWKRSFGRSCSERVSKSCDNTPNGRGALATERRNIVPKETTLSRWANTTCSPRSQVSTGHNIHIPKDNQVNRPRSSTTSSRSSKFSVGSSESSEFDFDNPPTPSQTSDKGKRCTHRPTSTPLSTAVTRRNNSTPVELAPTGKQGSSGNNGPGRCGANARTRVQQSVATYKKKMSSFDKSVQGITSSMSVKIRESITTQSFDDCSKSLSDSDNENDICEPLEDLLEKSVFVPEDEVGYPEPRPVTAVKSDIFHTRDFQALDQHVLQAEDSLSDSYDDLLAYLLHDVVTEISKVRAIFLWVVSQKLPLTVNKRDIVDDSPRGFLYNIRERRATYSELFAVLCRRAGIPCVIVYGVAKSVAYDVGDRVTHKKMRNNWNSVYFNNCWHLVHPYWASQSAKGYNSGRWAVVESDSFHSVDGSSSRLRISHKPNDFFFLTDPDKFITKCFPDNPVWQLMHKPLTKHEFEELPFIQPSFYELKLKTGSHNTCVIHADNGKAEITLRLPSNAEKAKRYKFKYKLYKHRDWEAEGEYDQILMERYLLHYIQDGVAVFEIRFPVSGDYKLELHCHDPKRSLPSDWICDYKIVVPESMENCQPLPIVPSIGWGTGLALEDSGVECLTHDHVMASLDKEAVTFMRFALPKDREVAIEANLLHNDLSPGELESHVTCEQDGDHAVIQISPPSEGEFALQVFMKERTEETRRNICNYLLYRTQIVEDPELGDIRVGLIRAAEEGDPEQIQHWMDQFIERNMEDRGDFTSAKKKLHLAKLNRDIAEAIARKDLSLLEKTLHSASDSSLHKQLGHLAAEAEAMRSRLRRLKRLSHAVMEMDQKTISEMRSYPKPPSAVHAILAATFLLLGNRESEVKKWSKVQALISKRGKEGLKRRVAEFKTNKVTAAVLKRAKNIISKYDLETVQIASTGAATFYQWTYTMIGEVEQELGLKD